MKKTIMKSETGHINCKRLQTNEDIKVSCPNCGTLFTKKCSFCECSKVFQISNIRFLVWAEQ